VKKSLRSFALDSCKAALGKNNAGSVWCSLETAGVQGLGPPLRKEGEAQVLWDILKYSTS